MMKHITGKAALFALSMVSASAFASHWGYEGEGSPEHWGELDEAYKTCQSGMNQSPINIDSTANAHLSPLQTHYIDGPVTLTNNGHTIQASEQADTRDTLTLDKQTWTLQQFHFHAPSENLIDGHSYPLEVHKLFPDIKVSGEACPLWVSLVENNEAQGEGTDYFIRKNIGNLLAKDTQIDTVILGCTHFPLLLPKIQQYMPDGITTVTQGELVADSLKDYLHRHPEMDKKCTKGGRCVYRTTESEEKFTESASTFLNESIRVERIEL